ncbi:hypothetical protein G3N55_03370 [Dissulfurirhabdus thermomarina]|uniref:Uncharacterized protein n=1 Tax=Dissulfurirhabdus thermomarina TaxID=1765737 RepID=A0A6N9TLG7_DISTH|nr:hypothetical protein [Dissulfurirhabdus thermomarina]NDY41888.1 hypothetical protein [Dissulfurirhabdus thermomarina]NMX23704.1 hypothetical protein [Dissulfurirhabdus thermomarina]
MKRAAFWVVNGFCHDLATGLWAGFLAVLFLLAAGLPPAATRWGLFRLCLAALCLVAVTGALRLVEYRRRGEARPPARLLLAKHVLLGLLFLGGTLWGYFLAGRGAP